MNNFAKFIALIIFLTLFLNARVTQQKWDNQYEVSLKKDVPVEFKIQDKIREKKFKIYWTLFINKGLIVIANLDGYPYQFVLYKENGLNNFKMELAKAGSLLLVELQDFIQDSKEAKLKIMFKNSKSEMVNQQK